MIRIQRWFHTLRDGRNRLDYSLRQAIRFRRGAAFFRSEPKNHLFAELTQKEQVQAQGEEERLRRVYHLEPLYQRATVENYRENLFYVSLLETCFQRAGVRLPDPLTAVDIGPSSWFYVQGLASLLRYWDNPTGREFHLVGYEADAFRVYRDFRSRWDHAQAHLMGLEQAKYCPQPFGEQPAQFDLILMLFPFVFLQDHRQWGLPENLFSPETLLRSAWNSCKPGGWLVIVNQGLEEHQAEQKMLQKIGVPAPRSAFEFHSPFFTYDLARWALVCRHE